MEDAVTKSEPSFERPPTAYTPFQIRTFRKATRELQRWYPSLTDRILSKGGLPARTNVLFYQLNRAARSAFAGQEQGILNKLTIETTLRRHGIPTTTSRMYWNGQEMLHLSAPAQDGEGLFAKPVNGSGGQGAFVYTGQNLPAKTPYVIQTRIDQSDETMRFNPPSLNTLRILTYRKMSGAFSVIAAILRMGVRNSPVDNASSGGLFCTLDLSTGALAEFASGKDKSMHSHHPSTHLKFSEHRISALPDVSALCEKSACGF